MDRDDEIEITIPDKYSINMDADLDKLLAKNYNKDDE